MKFSVSSSELLRKLQMAGSAISSNPVIAILEDFLFTIEDKKLIIAASDLETSIITELEIMADSEGSVAIPAKILLDTLKALPPQPVTFSINPDNFGVEITSAYGKYRLAGENGQDFPKLPEPDSVDVINISSEILVEGITNTLFAASTDDLRPAMTGIYFQLDFNKIILVATDAHKLVKYTQKEITSNVSTAFIVPRKSLNHLKNILPDKEKVELAFNKSNAFFKYGDTQMICRLIDARYPDYNAVIPVENPNLLTLNRVDFLNSLKRNVIYANKTTNQVILNIQDKSMTISAQDLDYSNEATEQMVCQLDGNALTIGFNAKFLIEMLTVLDTEEVKMELSVPSRAGILKPADVENGSDVMMLLMPVMLGS